MRYASNPANTPRLGFRAPLLAAQLVELSLAPEGQVPRLPVQVQAALERAEYPPFTTYGPGELPGPFCGTVHKAREQVHHSGACSIQTRIVDMQLGAVTYNVLK